jgi:hypothetical protein
MLPVRKLTKYSLVVVLLVTNFVNAAMSDTNFDKYEKRVKEYEEKSNELNAEVTLLRARLLTIYQALNDLSVPRLTPQEFKSMVEAASVKTSQPCTFKVDVDGAIVTLTGTLTQEDGSSKKTSITLNLNRDSSGHDSIFINFEGLVVKNELVSGLRVSTGRAGHNSFSFIFRSDGAIIDAVLENRQQFHCTDEPDIP